MSEPLYAECNATIDCGVSTRLCCLHAGHSGPHRSDMMLAREQVAAMKKRDDLALMQATIREQLELNNKLAFELGGLKWEVGFVRRLLRTILSFPTDRTETDAYTAEQYDGLCRARKDALAYLDGAPQEEDS